MGRPPLWAEDMRARFPNGTFSRIAKVLREREDRTDFVREAIENELLRREALGNATSPEEPSDISSD
ncbi:MULTISPECIES: hypothetical protein [Asaia]|uniref:Uncharacterized protein n=1 Tax=Asaia spathodeae TaxID=657016 RepID=A0ABX2P878_9PROT|nr:hypothetical protein [Asaia spathodeae]GBR20381.1 hypothetical protein AA105894_2546 [Asaia spathodeae NBRC 105894]